MQLADLRASLPELEGLSDADAVDVVHQAYYPDLPAEQVHKALGYVPTAPAPAAAPAREQTWMDSAGDALATGIRGAISVPEGVVGLADMVTGGHAGKMAEEYLGFRPAEAKQIVSDALNSDERKAQLQEMQQADGVMAKLGVAARNPSIVGHVVGESIPGLLAGQLAGRAVMGGVGMVAPHLAGRGAALAGGVGEGVMAAGSQAEQIRQQTEDGLLTGQQSALAAGTGLATSVIGAFGNKLAQSMGLKDVDTLLLQASQSTPARKGLVRSVVEGAVAEGFLEELPQSVVEQVAQNLALGKALDEGVDEAAVLGTLAGMGMGGGMQLMPDRGPMSRAVNAGAASGAIAPGMAGIAPPSPAPGAPGAPPAPAGAAPAVDPNLQQTQSPPAGANSAAPMGEAASPLAAPPGFEQTQPVVARVDVSDPFAISPPDVDVTAPANAFEQRERDRPRGEEALTDPLPTDTLTSAGAPFKTMGAALSALNRAGGEAAGDIVRVKGGLVIRPKGSADGSGGVSAGGGVPAAGEAAGADLGGGLAADGRGADDARAAVAGGGDAPGDAAAVPGPADAADPALSEARERWGRSSPVTRSHLLQLATGQKGHNAKGYQWGGIEPGLQRQIAQAMGLEIHEPNQPSAQPAAQAAGAEAPAAGEGAAGPAGAADPVAGAADVQAAGLTPITADEARKLVAGKTEKPGGVDPVKQIDAGEGNGKRYLLGDVPLDQLPPNEEGDRFDGTVDLERAKAYAARPADDVPPVILVRGKRSGGQLRVLDGGHRVSAARLRGDKTIRALVAEVGEGAGPVAETTGLQQAETPAPAATSAPAAAEPAVTPPAAAPAPALAPTAEQGAAEPQAALEPASTSAANPAPAQENAPAPVAGNEVVEHVTKAGKTIRGVWRDDLDKAQAGAIDPHTFQQKGKGWFIREKHLGKLPARAEQKPASEPPKGVREQRQEKIDAKKPARRGKVGDMVEAGEVLLTSSGRRTTPFPPIKWDTDRKAANTVRAGDRWLMENALAEAEARGDDFNAGSFRQSLEEGRRPSQADKDSAEEYLFGEQPPVQAPFLRPMGEKPAAAPAPVTVRPAGPGAIAITIDPSAGRPAAPAPEESSKAEESTKAAPSANTIFTQDAYEKARALLRSKLGQVNSGIDPEVLQAGLTMAGYHIEKGARTFAAFAKAMLEDLGDAVRPYLKSFYMAAKYHPQVASLEGLSSAAEVEGADVAAIESTGDKSLTPVAEEGAAPAGQGGDITAHFLEEIKAGRMPKDNPALKKLVEAFDGKPADPARMKVAQEHLEAAIVQRARELVKANPIRGDRATFDALLELYRSQPNLNVRTSTSIANQAYSTPAPLAFLSSRLTGITSESTVLEPTAGTGMLVIGAKPGNVHANEIEPTRQGLLLDQGFDVTRRDATEPNLAPAGSVDAVIANPPFGPFAETKVDTYRLSQIDHVIAARALAAMKDDGRATLILGANKVAGGQSEADRIFLNWLYGHYNVTSHFEVEGDLYARQGAGWPVRVITISGRNRSSLIAPKVGTIQRASTWEQVYEQYEQSLAAGRAPDAGAALGAGRAGTGGNGAAAVPPAAGGQAAAAGAAPDAPRAPRGTASVGGAAAGALQPGAGGSERAGPGNGAAADGHPADAARPDRLEQPRDAAAEPGAKPGRVPGAAGALTPPEQANTFQAKYVPRSSRKDEDVLIPVNMAGPLQDALSHLEDEVGDIDEFAAKELGYDSIEQMHEALMGLQVDAVAAAIYQIKERGKGVIIADQTGIGKGRSAAAMIRWAMRNGRVPIFMTVGDNLFTSMYGDLQDIGSSDAKPFLINREAFISGEGSEKLFTNRSSALHSRVIDRIAATGQLPEGANVLFSTYSQINVDNRQRKAIMALADKAVFILDESHKAGGDSATGKFMRGAIDLAPGTVYLSATFAKRPDNMPLYFKTDLGDAMDPEALTAAMAAGGLPLQTVVSANLVAAGQLFRRERSFEGISIVTETDTAHGAEHREIADKATEALRAIVDADHAFHTTYFDSLREAYDQAAAGDRALDGAGNQASDSVNRTEFSSVVHNFVRQILLGMTAQTAADDALAAVKRGERALIAFENTMGSFLNEYAQQNNLKAGDKLGVYDYRNVLTRALERSRYYTLKKANGDKERVQVPLSDLDPETYDAYRRAQEVIDALRIKLPASPIDWMRHVITSGGHTVKEITGRTMRVDYADPKAPTLENMPKEEMDDRVLTARQFNGSDGVAPSLDVILLNVAGSTGISLHAAAKFANQAKRHMIVAQAAGDINTFMQMLGRSNRTGQVVKPGYKLLQPDLPAVRRPAAVLSSKMKKLNANTSSNTESATSVEAVDMLNKYGDQIVSQYLADNPQLAQALRLNNEVGEEGGDATEDIAKKATGRLALRPWKEQEEFYEEVEGAYRTLIEYLDKTNQNDLVPRTFDFDARETKSQVLYEGEKPESPFGADAVYGEYSIKAQGKPMTPAEIRDEMERNLDGTPADVHVREIVARLEKAFLPWTGSVPEALRETAEKQRREAREFLQQHPIGTLVRVQINDDAYNAAVLNIRSTHKTAGNPFAMSKIQVTVAVNGALRNVTVPATQFRKIEVANLQQTYRLETLFQAPREGDRETVKIVTGNLLAAFGEIKTAGRIISFTKADGTVEQGILLPKKFALGTDTDRSYRMRSPQQVLDFLHTSTHDLIDKIGANTRDQQVRVLPYRREGVQIRVPKSKAKGGKYFLDKELLQHTGDFTSHGSFMSAYVEDRAAAEAALARVMKMQALYVVESMAEEAKTKLPKDDAKLSVSDNTLTGDDKQLSPPQNGGDENPSATDVERGNKLAERLAGAYPGHLFDVVAAGGGHSRRPGSTARAAAWVAKQLFGHDTVFVRFRGKQSLFEGAFYEAVPDAVFLNADADKPHLAVLGHELLHRLRRERPDLYAALQARLARVMKDVDQYRAALEAKYKEVANAPLPANWLEELHADIVGDYFVDPAFWSAMAGDKPGLFRRVANAVVKFLDDVKAALAGAPKRPFGTDKFIADIDAARAAVVEAMRGFGEQRTAAAPAKPAGDDLALSISDALGAGLNSVREARLPANYMVGDLFAGHGTVSWWHKTVGTPYNLAKRSKTFKRVYDAVQNFLGDVSHYASQAADLAPTILPKLEHFADLKKAALSATDRKAIAAPIFQGTLEWTRDAAGKPVRISEVEEGIETLGGTLDVHGKAAEMVRRKLMTPDTLRMWQGRKMEVFETIINNKWEREVAAAGIVWTDAELKSQFNLNEQQIGLYKEFRAATDQSLQDLAVAEIVRTAGKEAAPVRAAMIDAKTAREAVEILKAHIDQQLDSLSEQEVAASPLNDVLDKALEKRDRIEGLIKRGYAPLSRFGQHSVYVTDKDTGEQVSFRLFESKAEANRYARLERRDPAHKVEQGTMSQERYKQFAGISPETLEIFGEKLGLEQDEVFQKYLMLARSNRDAMKRMIRRKGTAGFSEDPGRVLAAFITSNARRTSTSLHTGEIEQALDGVDKYEGQLSDQAHKLAQYVRNPQEEAQGIRGLMFAQYLGGSIASAVVNLTQPITMTVPYLSQFGGGARAVQQVLKAWGDLRAGSIAADSPLGKALHQAEIDGIVSPQEIHQLQAQAAGRGQLRGGDGTMVGDAAANVQNRLAKVGLVWGRLFGFAEQVNRKTTFIAAYRIAEAKGIADPAAFAAEAVAETQGVYNKGNKPRWARGAVGSTLFTFKQFSVAYVELLTRMWQQGGPEGKKAALLALAILFLAAGADELPFVEDVEDVLDGLGQRVFGLDLSVRRVRNEWIARTLGGGEFGRAASEFIAKGVSGWSGLPMDVSGRLGMGDLIPGTGFALKKADHTRDFESLAGPVADMGKRFVTAAGQLLEGKPVDAALSASPVAVRNFVQGGKMLDSGQYEDRTGKKVLETTQLEGALKAIGFQPNAVARVQQAAGDVSRSIGLARMEESEIADQIAKGFVAGDRTAVADARQRLKDWNRKNPHARIAISPTQIRQRIKKLKQTRAERLAATAPKEMRSQVQKDLGLER